MMKAVLFDFGGTIDTNGIHWSEKFWDIYRRHSIPVSKQDYEKAYVFAENNMKGQIKPYYSFKYTLTTQLRLQIEYLEKMDLIHSDSLEIIVHELARSCYEDVGSTIKDAKRYLDRLSKNYLLGVISNFYGNLETVLKEFSIAGYFSSIVDSEVAGLKKPNPDIFLYSLKELNAEPFEAWMVGDSYDRDIQPAKTAGIKTVWLDGRSWQRPVSIEDADFRITSLSELNNIIN